MNKGEAIVYDARRDVIKRQRRHFPPPTAPFVVVLAGALIVLVVLVLYQEDVSLQVQLNARILQQEPTTLIVDEQQQYSYEHKPLIPLNTHDVVGLLLASLGLLLAAGGGIGGGGILVPIYILVMKFPAKHAIPLSNVTVFGGAIANTLLNIRKQHPIADRPLIDWNIIAIMEPLTILGSLIGANLNKLLPGRVIVVLLVVLLSLTAYKTLSKAIKLHETETYSKVQQYQDDQDEESDDDEDSDVELGEMNTCTTFPPSIPKRSLLTRGASDSSPSLVVNKDKDNNLSLRSPHRFRRSASLPSPDVIQATISAQYSPKSKRQLSYGSLKSSSSFSNKQLQSESSFDLDVLACTNSIEAIQNQPRNPDLARILLEERHAPLTFVCYIASLFFFVLVVNILKGGGAFESPLGIECGSLGFWIAEIGIAVVICVVSCKARSTLLHYSRVKHEAGYQYLDCDIEWNETSTFYYPLLSGTAGLVAGLFGIGGGIIKGPLMLALGVHPAVASATSACMILFTSFTATTSFAVFGLLVEDYAIVGLIVGFVATLLGQTIMSWVLKRYQRNSYIAFCIGVVVLLSAICMTIESIITISRGGGRSTRSGLCSTHLE